MDRALGTGLFEGIVSSGAKPEWFDIALLVLLKLRPNVDSNITKKIFHEPIINRVVSGYSEILGNVDIVKGIEHFGFWPLLDAGGESIVKRKFFVRMNYPESPFEIEDHLGLDDLVITSSDDRKDISLIPLGLVRHLETCITKKRFVASRNLASDILPGLLDRCDDDGISAMSKVSTWGNTPVTGACQSLSSAFI